MQALIAEAKESGYQEGYNQGEENGYREYRAKLEQARQIVRRASDDYEQVIVDAEPVILELAQALCERMLRVKLKEEHSLWMKLLAQVMQEVREHEQVKIYVEPVWFEWTLQQKEELKRLLLRAESLHIYPDADLPENGCIVETEFGRLEASLDSQLTELKKQLLESLKEE